MLFLFVFLWTVFNLILPCVLITGIALMSFYMPSDSGEKVTLGITTLLSMTVFLMVSPLFTAYPNILKILMFAGVTPMNVIQMMYSTVHILKRYFTIIKGIYSLLFIHARPIMTYS